MKTEGQVLLLRVTRRQSEERIATKCGVKQSTISRWIWGRAKPLYENRKTLLEQFQIPMEAWDRPAEGT